MKKLDDTVTLDQAKSWVQKFCEERGWDPYHNPKDLAIGLVTEASELLEVFRFVSEQGLVDRIKEPAMRSAIADELADSLYFILRFSQLYGFDLSECLQQKLIKNTQKYPAAK